MAITAALVKELRERTGAGMMDCKKILTETDGDIELAIEELRKRGAAQADKKAGRIAAEGTIVTLVNDGVGVAVEVNSETDFVAKDDGFMGFANAVAQTVIASKPQDLEGLMGTAHPAGGSIEEARQSLIAKIGENIGVRRFQLVAAGDGEVVGAYQHGNKISVLVRLKGGNEELAKDIAMHIAASRPVCISTGWCPPGLDHIEHLIFHGEGLARRDAASLVNFNMAGCTGHGATTFAVNGFDVIGNRRFHQIDTFFYRGVVLSTVWIHPTNVDHYLFS